MTSPSFDWTWGKYIELDTFKSSSNSFNAGIHWSTASMFILAFTTQLEGEAIWTIPIDLGFRLGGHPTQK